MHKTAFELWCFKSNKFFNTTVKEFFFLVLVSLSILHDQRFCSVSRYCKELCQVSSMPDLLKPFFHTWISEGRNAQKLTQLAGPDLIDLKPIAEYRLIAIGGRLIWRILWSLYTRWRGWTFSDRWQKYFFSTVVTSDENRESLRGDQQLPQGELLMR